MSKTLRLFYRIFSCLLNISNGHNAPAPPSFSFVKYPRPLRVNNKIYWEVVVNWATYYLKINIFKYLFKTFSVDRYWPALANAPTSILPKVKTEQHSVPCKYRFFRSPHPPVQNPEYAPEMKEYMDKQHEQNLRRLCLISLPQSCWSNPSIRKVSTQPPLPPPPNLAEMGSTTFNNLLKVTVTFFLFGVCEI